MMLCGLLYKGVPPYVFDQNKKIGILYPPMKKTWIRHCQKSVFLTHSNDFRNTKKFQISAILHENSYLRWENEQFIIEMESLREKLDAEFLKTKELKAEIRCLQVNQKQINQIHSARYRYNSETAIYFFSPPPPWRR